MTTLRDEMMRQLALANDPTLALRMQKEQARQARLRDSLDNLHTRRDAGPLSVIGDAIKGHAARRDLHASRQRSNQYMDQLDAERKNQQQARISMAEQHPDLAPLLSTDPRVQAAGSELLKRQTEERKAAAARAAEIRAFERSLFKSDYENRQSQEAATLAYNRSLAKDQVLSAPQMQSGLKDARVALQPLISLKGKIDNLDAVLQDYAKGGKYEGKPIPGLGGIQGMVGGTPRSSGALTGAAAGAAAGGTFGMAGRGGSGGDTTIVRETAEPISEDEFAQVRKTQRFSHPMSTGAKGLLGAGLAALGLDQIAGSITPGRAGAFARLAEGGDQAVFTAVQDLVSQIVRTNAGLSQTQSELETVRNSIGAGNMSPEVAFLRAYPRIKAALEADLKLAEKSSHPQVRQQLIDDYTFSEVGPGKSPFDSDFTHLDFPQLTAAQEEYEKKRNPKPPPSDVSEARKELREDLLKAFGTNWD